MSVYPIAASGQRIVFSRPVLDHFERYRQNRWWKREAGGQLFARVEPPDILVQEATGPRASDWRTRLSYRPNRLAEQQEITNRHSQGLHFIGDWHTHPEATPTPSVRDIDSVKEMYYRSKHNMNGFLFVIVGIDPRPNGIFVSVTDGRKLFQLFPCSPDADDQRLL